MLHGKLHPDFCSLWKQSFFPQSHVGGWSAIWLISTGLVSPSELDRIISFRLAWVFSSEWKKERRNSSLRHAPLEAKVGVPKVSTETCQEGTSLEIYSNLCPIFHLCQSSCHVAKPEVSGWESIFHAQESDSTAREKYEETHSWHPLVDNCLVSTNGHSDNFFL